ncbi:protein kinase [Aliifodinibius sp. S!AR15-10]|uniref:protein kinase domain-containing protein n=1 Tax=Aliifodinibius sp. S!AR15-10 TaxID=2950437 RepID=UPI002861A452|nr:protein kinase [Aliifodinibius sp. S!AR15-10]MDR8390937.1 protein kinase [Aliifodinibius sp. S!AR15-10]
MQAKLHIELLGGFNMSYNGEPATDVHTSRLQELIVFLVLHRNSTVSRKHIAFLFWPDSSEQQALTNLRNLLYRLRKALPGSDRFIFIDNQNLRWNSEKSLILDVAEFEHLAKQLLTSDDKISEIETFKKAADLYNGPLLPGCYSEWIESYRNQLHQHYQDILQELIHLLEIHRDYEAAISYARKLQQSDPYSEPACRKLMELYSKNNDRANAINTYREYFDLVREDLKSEPAPETRRLYQQIVEGYNEIPPPKESMLDHDWPLVGRDHEWEILQKPWRQALSGQMQAVIIKGEPGIGKTRLGLEFMNTLRNQGYPTAYSRCYEAAGAFSYGPVIDWLKEEAIHQHLGGLDSLWLTELVRLVPELLAEHPDLSLPGPISEPWQQRQLYEAIARGLAAGDKPRLLFIDDLQWCDRQTLEWISYLFHNHPDQKLLLVGALRPVEAAPNEHLQTLLQVLRRQEQLQELSLGMLNEEETEVLASSVARQSIAETAAKRLYRESEGHPLFVVEAVREGQWMDEVDSEVSSYQDEVSSDQPLPKKVNQVISSRFRRLSGQARQLMGVAAVIGREFTLDILRQASELDEPALIEALEELIGQHIMRRQRSGEYDFTHDKLREVAYGELSDAHRRWLHERVAAATEDIYTGSINGLQSRMTWHYEHAGLPEKANLWKEKVDIRTDQPGAGPDPLELEGTSVGRYEVREYLGGGAMGVVYRACDTRLDRSVALKFLPPHLSTSDEAKRRFVQEAKAASALDHPNIATVYEIGQSSDDRHFIAMAYYPGETLKTKIARGPLPVGKALNYAVQIAEGLARAHQAGIIHRDIKPANMMVTNDELVKIVDFGLAKVQQVDLTRTGQTLGTAAYMSPEQTRGETMTPATDIWSLGAVLYEMLTGQRPFGDTNSQAIIYAIRNDEPEPMDKFNKEIPTALQAIVACCLEKDPTRRYTETEELATHLRAIRDNPSAQIADQISWNKYLLQASGICIVAGLFIFGAAWFLTFRLGLPEWTLWAAVALLAIGVPSAAATALVERIPNPPQKCKDGSQLESAAYWLNTVAGRWLRWSLFFRWNALAFGCLGVVVTGYMASRTLGVGPFATLIAAGTLEEQDRIVLADFATQTVDSTLVYTVTEALRADLAQAPAVNLADQARVTMVLESMKRAQEDPLDYDTAREVAIREGFKAVVAGQINTVGSAFVLSARLVAAENGRELVTVQETAESDDTLIGAIERLSRGLRERIGESLSSIRESPGLGRYRTASLEALKRFSLGYRAIEYRADWEGCIKYMTEALAIDSLFAAAYSFRSVCNPKLDMKLADLRRAYRLRDRMNDFGRAAVTHGYYRRITGEFEKGIQVLESHWKLHPEDSIRTMFFLSDNYSRLGQYNRAEELVLRGKHAIEILDTELSLQWPLNRLAFVQLRQGEFDEVEKTIKLLEELEEKEPNTSTTFPIPLRAKLAFVRGEYSAAVDYVREWRNLNSKNLASHAVTSAHWAMIALAQGKLTEVEFHYRDAMEANEVRGDLNWFYQDALRISMSHLWLASDTSRALSVTEEILTRHPLDSLNVLSREYHRLAIAFAQLGQPARAKTLLKQARDSLPQDMQGRFKYDIHRARGWIAVAEGRLDEAAGHFERLQKRPTGENQIDRLFALGLIYDRVGAPDSAITYYEQLVSRLFKGLGTRRLVSASGP